MHRNTYLLVIVLSIFASLLVGINIGKKLQTKTEPALSIPTPTPTPVVTLKTYLNTYCGFSFSYPSTFTVLGNASGSAILHNTKDKTQTLTFTCQQAIPRPALPAEKIETLTIPASTGASVSAKLYHESSPKDGTLIDTVIFRHPTNGMDGFIAGFGEAFDTAIKTLQILP